MTGVFLSYAHADVADALRLEAGLEAAGYTVFRDADRDGGIPAGTLWAHELFANLERSEVVVFLASALSLASPWCHTELAVAVARGKIAVQVQVAVAGQDAVPVHPLLADRQALPPQPGMDALVPALVADLTRAGFPASLRFSWDPDRSPYPGLQQLTAEYAPVLFGRDREVGAVVERLASPDALPVLVIGPSGSGKSSVVRAGVLPRLARQDGLVVLPPVEPGPAPLRRLAAALRTVDPGLDRDRLETDPDGVAAAVDGLTAHGGRVVVFLDQSEDLLSAPRPQVEAFVAQLRRVPRDRLGLVVALRSASLDAWSRDPLLGPLTPGDPVSVQPLQRNGLREIVLGPARLAGITFEPPELVERMLDDTGDGQALPLLAALLEELTRGHSREAPVVVTTARYEEIGPVQRVIERRAEQATAELHATLGMSETEVVDAYLRLADVEPDLQLVRTEVPLDSVPPRVAAAFAVFERVRLVTEDRRDAPRGSSSHHPTAPAAGAAGAERDTPGSDGSTDGVEVVLPMHEEVFRAWPALAAAIPARRADLVLRSSLRREAAAWRAGRGDPVPLAGKRLADAVDWVRRTGDDADGDVTAYVATAVRQARRRRALTVATPLLAVVALVVASLAVVAFQQKRAADAASGRAQALRLAADARRVETTRPDLSLLLSLEAAARSDDPQVLAAPFVALTRGYGPRAYLTLPGRPTAAALDGDGGRAILVVGGQTLQWDAVAAKAVARSEAAGPAPAAVAVSADGTTVATASPGGLAVARWGASGPSSTCQVPGGTVERLLLSADGALVVAVAVDRSVAGGRSVVTALTTTTCAARVSAAVDGLVRDVAVDPATDVLAAAVQPGVLSGADAPGVRTWQLSSGLPYPAPVGSGGRATAVALGAGRLGALGPDGTLRVWEPATSTDPPTQTRGVVSSGARLAYLPAAARWLAAGTGGDLRTVAGDGSPPQDPAVRSLPPLGDRAAAEPLALAATSPSLGATTATTVDGAGRLVHWSFDVPTALGVPVPAPARVEHVAATSDGAVVSAGPDGLWIVPEQAAAHQVPSVTSPTAVATRGVQWAAGGSSGAVWFAATADTPPRALGSLGSPVAGVAVLASGEVGAVDTAGRLSVLSSPQQGPRAVDLHEQAQAVATDGRRLFVVTRQGSLFTVDTAVQALSAVRTPGAHDNATSVAVSADGRWVATGGDDRRIVVWDVTGTEPVKRLELSGSNEKVISLAFQPDGRRLASGSEDSQVILWSLADDGNTLAGSQLAEGVTMPTFPALTFVPTAAGRGQQLAVGGEGLSRWPMDDAAWRRVAWSVLGARRLTAVEQEQYLPGEAPVATP